MAEVINHGDRSGARLHVSARLRMMPIALKVPAKYDGIDRGFLLDTSFDPPRPWTQTTDLPVFALALVRGEEGAREWLLYAHAPREDRKAVEITIPEFGAVRVDVPRKGAFTLVRESTPEARQLRTE